MTIGQACARVERSRPGVLTLAEKITHLSALDSMVYMQIISRHEGDQVLFTPYSESSPLDTKLLCPDGYAELYIRYLEAQCDCLCGEIERYEGSSAMFNSLWQDFLAHWREKHRPKGARKWIL